MHRVGVRIQIFTGINIMPIIFISLSETYIEKIKQYGFEAKTMKIEDYISNSNRKTYYVSPANSLCFTSV